MFSKTVLTRVRHCPERTTCGALVTAPGEARVTGLRRETSGTEM
ncbi:hypothetical protein Desku_1768 [Desulfofundulus kuznetsovii DSM 6115]|uniref:Uncharacterized protein n=1 Tax=Desulfofundulus kuznetsovii (strain DSM 6115 / VKM B-1805 / 17) TaxID=760568 RepID=A0AAU8PDE8_DESK7|nr:hypothetical protein Desku_1768 [Desulfofundulus kuznetsovii DSM 6115]